MDKRQWKEYREQAKKLRMQMTLEEKTSQLSYRSPAVARLGIPAYNWWNEALHGVARAGTSTSFPQMIGMAASFDEDLIEKMADVIATEGRAKYEESIRNQDRDIYKGLTFWCPNVNIFRDPRWGRGHETFGEDPYLTSRLGIAYVKGLQGDSKHLKSAACVKHFAVHSGPEAGRHEFDAKVSLKDLYETYLPAFEACVKEGQAVGVMGAYNRVNGEVSCGSTTLLEEILRKKWGFDGYVVSDCGAIADFHMHHGVTNTAEESAAMALKAGCDLNCGNIYLYVEKAVRDGLAKEEDVDVAVDNLLTIRMALGMFEPNEYENIPFEVVECQEHIELAEEAAVRSMVLLKNDGILPLEKDKIKSIAVIGPNANSRDALKANYFGTSSRYTTVLEGIQQEVGEEIRVYYAQGAHLYRDQTEAGALMGDRLQEALSTLRRSDVVILCLGLDANIEGEEGDANNEYAAGDKRSLELPASQKRLLHQVLEEGNRLNKPVILCMMAGSAMDLREADEKASAILQLWYPGARGGKAAADILFGKKAPSGKLPVTFYRSTEELPPFEEYAMRNRTYRYFTGEVQYPFGFGLTYGEAVLKEASAKNTEAVEMTIKALIENTGKTPVREILQVYAKNLTSNHAPLHPVLCGMCSFTLEPGEQREIELNVPVERLKVVDEEGISRFDGEEYEISIGFGQPDRRTEVLTGQKAITIPMQIK